MQADVQMLHVDEERSRFYRYIVSRRDSARMAMLGPTSYLAVFGCSGSQTKSTHSRKLDTEVWDIEGRPTGMRGTHDVQRTVEQLN